MKSAFILKLDEVIPMFISIKYSLENVIWKNNINDGVFDLQKLKQNSNDFLKLFILK